MKKFIFLKNAAILTITSLILRTVGIFLRIYLAGKIGAEGMGLYQLVFSIYVLAATFAASGISTSVTRLITEDANCGSRRSVQRILRRAMVVSFVIGVISALIMIFGAYPIAKYALNDTRAVYSLQILAFGLPFMGISSCLRGYFIARRKISRSTESQLLEQVIRIAIIMLIIDRFTALGIGAACAAIMIGDTIAEIISCIHMGIAYKMDNRHLSPSGEIQSRPIGGGPRILRRMMNIAIPITAGRYLNTALRTGENLLVPGSLTKHSGSRERGLSEFGMLKGMAMPILFFPASFLTAFSTLLIPEISEASALGHTARVEQTVRNALRITLSASIPIAGIFLMFAKPLGELIYGDTEVGFLIGALAPIVPFMYLESVVDGLLKGLDQQVSSLKYSMIDSVLRISAILLLVPKYGMQGFLFVMIVSNILTASLNIRRLLVVTGVHMQWTQWLLKPLLAVASAGCAVYFLQRTIPLPSLPMIATTALLAAISLIVYGTLLMLFGCITRKDFEHLHRTEKHG